MLTKGNDAKVQNEVMAQIVADTSAKWMKFTRLLPKQEIYGIKTWQVSV